MADLGSLEAQGWTTRSLIEVPKDGARLVGVNHSKLTIQRSLLDIEKFDSKTANLFASEKKWDELKGYLGQFASKDSDMVNLFIQFEQHIIELVKDVKYGAALSVIKDKIIPSIHASACNDMMKALTNHLLFLQEQVEVSMSVFDPDIAIAFITKKDLKGLKEYLKAFINNDPHDEEIHNHPGFMLTLDELELIEALEGQNLDLAHKIFEDKIKPMKALYNDEMFMHVGFLRRIQRIESSLKSIKDFHSEYKEKKTVVLFDRIRSYFCEPLRLLIESDKSLFQFVYKGNAPVSAGCLACDWVIPASKGQKYFEHHVAHSEECKNIKINECDGLTHYLSRQVNACKFKKSDPLPATDRMKFSLEKKENGHSGKRRKVNDESESCSLSDRLSIVESCGKDDEAISAENELPEDDPAIVIGSVLTKNIDIRRDVAKLDSSVSAGVSAICNDQTDIIFDLQHLICQHPLDSQSVLTYVYKLEKKNTEFFPFINVLPSAVQSKILEFVDVTSKLRSVFMRLFCARSVPAPPVCELVAELVKINFEINTMIKRSAVSSGDKITKICKLQHEEVVKMVKLFHIGKIDAELVLKCASSISEINSCLLPLVELLPREVPYKLSDMYVVIFKLQSLCLQEKEITEDLP